MMKVSILLISTFIVCGGVSVNSRGNPEGRALLGAKKCTWGPSYWCSHIRHAAECHATQHCIKNVWDKQTLPEDLSDVCTICKDMVAQARAQLQSNMTREELKEVLEGSCKLIPVTAIADECCALADEFIPQLIEVLVSEMNPQVVCSTAGLCNRPPTTGNSVETRSTEESHDIAQPNNGVGDQCRDCSNYISDVINTVKKESVDEFLNRILVLCGQLGALADGCKMVANSYIDLIYNFITQQLNPTEFCQLTGMCQAIFGETQLSVVKNKEDPTCSFCEAILVHWRTVLTSNTTEEEFKQVLDAMCQRTGSFAKECQHFVDEYTFVIFNYIMHEMDPHQVCEAVGLCKQNRYLDTPIWLLKFGEFDVQPKMKLEKPKAAKKTEMKKILAAKSHKKAKVVKEYPIVKNDGLSHPNPLDTNMEQLPVERLMLGQNLVDSGYEMCTICEYALHYLQNWLMDNTTEAEIRGDVDKLCSIMPKEVGETCKSFVDQYGDAVIVILAQRIDPSQVCPMMSLCPKRKAEMLGAQLIRGPRASCPLCEFAMDKLIEILKDKGNEAIIRQDLDKACSYLPKSLSKECSDFVDLYAEQIIQMIVNGMEPHQVCVELKLCETATPQYDNSIPPLPVSRLMPEPMVESEMERFGSPACVICEFAMRELDKILENKQDEEEVKNAVLNICSYLPSTVSKDCTDFVNEYADTIIELLVSELAPAVICKQIGVCLFARSIPVDIEAGNFPLCTTCEVFVDYVDKILEDKTIDDQITSELEKICKFLPKSSVSECDQIVDMYGKYVINLLAELANGKAVCQKLDLCARPPGHVQLLGGESCTWGPSYWCQDLAHAHACNALAHCQQRVWNGDEPAL